MYPFIDIVFIHFPTYGLCMLIGIFLVVWLASRRAKPEIVFDDILIVASCTLGALVAGGYILYLVVTYSVWGIISRIANGDFSFLLNNGLVFYGGLIGGIFGFLLGKKLTKANIRTLENAFVPYVPLGHAIGRVGCALAGCCYGMKYDGPLAIYYPSSNKMTSAIAGQGYFPVQFMEAALDVCIMFVLLYFARKERRKYNILFLYLFMYAIMRFVTELFRSDPERGAYLGVSTSQWISIGLVSISVIRFVYLKIKDAKNNKKSVN